MNDDDVVRANFWNESTGFCDCCGMQTKTIWGDLANSLGTKGIYFIHWTAHQPKHHPMIDIVLGPWGEGTTPETRALVSLSYRPRFGGGSFMVVNGKGRRADDRSLCGRALTREDVIGTPLADEVFSLVDSLWLAEPRVQEIRTLDNIV